MHILIIPAWYKNKEQPYSGVFFEEQARALQKLGHKVGIIVPLFLAYDSNTASYYTEYDDDGLFTITQGLRAIVRRSNKINNTYFVRRLYAKAFKNYVKHQGIPDLIHSHVYKYSGLLGIYIAKRKNIPHVYTEHFSVWVNPNASIPASDIRVLTRVLESSKKSFAVSHFLKNALMQKATAPIEIDVLPNMIHAIFFDNNKTILTKSKGFRFVNIGGFVTVKNQLMLLRVFANFINKYQVDAELYLVGDGELRSEIENRIIQLGLRNRVVLTGLLDRKQIKQLLEKSHVGVISSVVETFSIAGIEFMSQGLPVLSTDCGGPKDFIQDFNGMIVANEEEMLEGFNYFYKNYSLYDGTKIAEYIQQNFSESVVIRKLEETYKNILK